MGTWITIYPDVIDKITDIGVLNELIEEINQSHFRELALTRIDYLKSISD